MANVIKLKRSSVPGKVPAVNDLQIGELAVNTADGIIYTKLTDGSVKRLGGSKFVTASSQPTGQVAGDFWYNTSNDILYIYVVNGGLSFYLDISSTNTGYTGSTGSQGPIGYSGSQGDFGYTGSQGDFGYTGSIGYTGSRGTEGYTGSQGTQGIQGDVGATGPQGNTGATGPTGPDGATGLTGYTGSQGIQGPQGASFDLKGSVATINDLPPSGNELNDAYIVTADGNLYIWNGTSWFSVGKIVGATGATGPQGTTGYVGSQGASGLQGDVGATGVQGNTGATGVTGYTGSEGATGATGPSGTDGASGMAGYTGSRGATGYVGSQGDFGYTGSQGATGPRGYVGSFSGTTTDTVTILNLTESTDTTTGALVVSGGAGIDGNVHAGAVYTDQLFYANGTPYSATIVGSSNYIHVAKNGNDNNNGTINAPFLTIKAALAAATSGTSVLVAPGAYIEDNPVIIPARVSLKGDDLRSVSIAPLNPTLDLFYVKNASYVWGITIKDYQANGFAFDPSTPTQNIFVSPYIQNITSSTTAAGATAVKIDGNLNSTISTKAMILGFFTIINRNGIGVHLVNKSYSQAVNVYTIAANIGILAESGSFVTLNGSDNGIGNYGLKADGVGPQEAVGTTVASGGVGVFHIRGLTAQPKVNQTMTIDGDPFFYSIDTITQVDGLTWQVTLQEVYTTEPAVGATVRFYQRSAIIASAHTFEYVGAGTNPATALPQYGGIPIEANEVIQINGGRVTFTSTDHKGNFKIGANLVINQTTGIINGDSFNRSMFALLTPYILALEG